LTKFKWPYFCIAGHYSHVVEPAGSPTRTVYVDLTLTRSKVKVKVTDHLNFRQLAKPCILAAMTAAPFRGFMVYCFTVSCIFVILWHDILLEVLTHIKKFSVSLLFPTTILLTNTFPKSNG